MGKAAQRLHELLGIATGSSEGKRAHGKKNASATKSGSGRYHLAGHEKASAPLGRGRVSTRKGRVPTHVAAMAYFASKRVKKHGNKRGDGLIVVKPLKGIPLEQSRAPSHRQIKRARMAPLRAARLAALAA